MWDRLGWARCVSPDAGWVVKTTGIIMPSSRHLLGGDPAAREDLKLEELARAEVGLPALHPLIADKFLPGCMSDRQYEHPWLSHVSPRSLTQSSRMHSIRPRERDQRLGVVHGPRL